MENDTPTIRGSVAPSRPATPAAHVGLGKRHSEFTNTALPKRHRSGHEAVNYKRETEAPADTFTDIQSNRDHFRHDSETHDLVRHAPPLESASVTAHVAVDQSEAAETVSDVERDSSEGVRHDHQPEPEPRRQRLDLFMAKLREAVAFDTIGPTDSIPKTSYLTRNDLRAARTDDAKLEVFRAHRIIVFRKTLFNVYSSG